MTSRPDAPPQIDAALAREVRAADAAAAAQGVHDAAINREVVLLNPPGLRKHLGQQGIEVALTAGLADGDWNVVTACCDIAVDRQLTVLLPALRARQSHESGWLREYLTNAITALERLPPPTAAAPP